MGIPHPKQPVLFGGGMGQVTARKMLKLKIDKEDRKIVENVVLSISAPAEGSGPPTK